MVRVLTDLRLLASIALVVGLLAVAMWPRTIVVDLAPVTRGHLVVAIEEEGRTRVRERFRVAAPVAGRVLRIELQPGDRVTRGDVIARLQPAAPAPLDSRLRAEAVAAMKSAEASLGQARAHEERARATLAQAHRDLSRSRHLDAAGVTTMEELDARQTEVSLAAHTLSAAAAMVRAASANLARAQAHLAPFVEGGHSRTVMVKAPIDGIVLQRFHQSESVVTSGEPLVEIGDLSQLEIVTEVLSIDAVGVTPGTAAAVAHWGGDAALTATVRRVEPTGFTKVSALGVEEQRVNVVLDLADSGEDYPPLGDAYRVDAHVVLWEASDVVKVPTSALVRDGARWAVYVASKGRARHTVIALGRHTAREAEVRSGLVDGAMVVVHPSDQLRDGVRIKNRAAS